MKTVENKLERKKLKKHDSINEKIKFFNTIFYRGVWNLSIEAKTTTMK